jgi:hypothetical protein
MPKTEKVASFGDFNNTVLADLHNDLAKLHDSKTAKLVPAEFWNVLDNVVLILAELDARAGVAVGLESRIQKLENR